jgi:hypothetical protein
MTQIFMPLLIASAIVIALGTFGVTAELGAHPFWSTQITLIGAVAGSVLALIARATVHRRIRASLTFSGLGLAAFALASIGKSRFVASFAEDRVAGLFWYYGWIAAASLATAAIATLMFRRRR